MKLMPIIIALCLAGCATTGSSITQVGPDTYLYGQMGGATDFSAAALKSRLITDASRYCAAKSQSFELLRDSGYDAALGRYASAEIVFRCTHLR